MISALIWSYLLFILLIHGCTAPKSNEAANDPVTMFRARVKAVADDDPCSRVMWVFMEPPQIHQAKKACEDAIVAFHLLTPEEKAACPGAYAPDCRPLATCDDLIYGCTFVCNVGDVVEARNPTSGIYEQRLIPERKIKHVKVIVEEIKEKAKKKSLKRTRSADGDNFPSGPASGSGTKPITKRKYGDMFP